VGHICEAYKATKQEA